MTTTQTVGLSTTLDDAAEAREARATRSRRVARLVRASTLKDVARFDAAYSEVVKVAAAMRDITTAHA